MTQSNVGKFDKMYQFLSEQNFEIDENVPNEFKCNKCKKLLINSCVGSCSCQVCRRCINEMIKNGLDHCPGNNDGCKEEPLVNFVPDHVTNNKLSKLVLKCPDQMCLHKCELVKMEEHLRFCLNRSVECPFYGMGCNEEKLEAYKMNDHFQKEGYNHSLILIEMIGTLKNELKKSDERDTIEIEELRENAQFRYEEFQCILKNEFTQINEEMQKLHLQLISRIDGLEKWGDRQTDGPTEWKISNISNKRQPGTKIYSPIFYSKINSYKMQLVLGNDGDSDEIMIYLLIHASELDAHFAWPYQRKVTIKIFNKAHPNASKSITQYCNITQPDKNSTNRSESFTFSYTELSSVGLTLDDYFIIQCCEE